MSDELNSPSTTKTRIFRSYAQEIRDFFEERERARARLRTSPRRRPRKVSDKIPETKGLLPPAAGNDAVVPEIIEKKSGPPIKNPAVAEREKISPSAVNTEKATQEGRNQPPPISLPEIVKTGLEPIASGNSDKEEAALPLEQRLPDVSHQQSPEAPPQKISWRKKGDVVSPSLLLVMMGKKEWTQAEVLKVKDMMGGHCSSFCVIDNMPRTLFVVTAGWKEETAKRTMRDKGYYSVVYRSQAAMQSDIGYSDGVMDILRREL